MLFEERARGWGRDRRDGSHLMNISLPWIPLCAALAGCVLSFARSHAVVNVEFVTVGDPSNPPDQEYDDGAFGSVADIYRIGKFEVSLLEYTAFLNAVAATDTFNLWDRQLETDLNIVGISRSGTDESFRYSVIGDGNRPVTFVSWYEAARFVNWLHNGQPIGAQGAGTTETGAYTVADFSSGLFRKNAGALYWIPSEDEWYKAAYYDPSASGPSDDYWLYPTRTDIFPGNHIGAGANQANFYDGDYSVTQSSSYNSSQNYLTSGGSYFSESYYGTFDQAGNVFEWTDGEERGLVAVRGSAWSSSEPGASVRGTSERYDRIANIGFRVATVPEPRMVSLLMAASLLLACQRNLLKRAKQ